MKRITSVGIVSLLLLSCILGIGHINSANENKNNTPLVDKLNPIWNKTRGGKENDSGISSVIKDSGIYLTGSTKSYGNGSDDVLVMKCDLNGNEIWNRTWGGKGLDKGNAIAVYNSAIYVAGVVDCSITPPPEGHFLLLKYDLNGDYIWNRTWNTTDIMVWSIAVDSSGVYICGVSSTNATVIKYDFDGSLKWNKTWQNGWWNSANSIAIFNSSLYVGGNTQNNTGSGPFILRYDFNGNLIWNKSWNPKKYAPIDALVIHNSSIYTAASFGVRMGSPYPHMVLSKYDINGNYLWGQDLMLETSYFHSIAIDNSSIYLVGEKTDTWFIEIYDVYVIKCDLDGNYLWDMQWGGKENDSANSISIYNSEIYLIGYTESYGKGASDVLILKCNLDGGGGPSVPETNPMFIPVGFMLAVFIIIYRRKR